MRKLTFFRNKLAKLLEEFGVKKAETEFLEILIGESVH